LFPSFGGVRGGWEGVQNGSKSEDLPAKMFLKLSRIELKTNAASVFLIHHALLILLFLAGYLVQQ